MTASAGHHGAVGVNQERIMKRADRRRKWVGMIEPAGVWICATGKLHAIIGKRKNAKISRNGRRDFAFMRGVAWP